MEEIYEHLKAIDYSMICFLNKYETLHKYTKCISDVFIDTVHEYKKLIQKILQTYKQHVYEAVHQNFVEFREVNERKKEQEQKLTEIKENLKKASKLTNSNIRFRDDEEKSTCELNTELKIQLPYSTAALYKLRYYRNIFSKNYAVLSKNDNYLNACEQRKRFLEKLKSSAKTTRKEKNPKGTNDIFKDEHKNMIRILKENYFFKEAQELKEILIINKYLNRAKEIVNNIPHFLYSIIEEFELEESNFNENMYLFILLALNKWLKKVVIECERFISYKKNIMVKKNKEPENELFKKHSEYMNDILQRGVEQTNTQRSEKPFYPFPCKFKFNVNTSVLTYHFLYINRNLYDFLPVCLKNETKKNERDSNSQNTKMICLEQEEESLYMKDEIYAYNFEDELCEYNEEDIINSLGFSIDNIRILPNIFLICNYLLHEETRNIINEIYCLQRNSYDLLCYHDVSIIIQLMLCLLKELKQIFKRQVGDYIEEGELAMKEKKEEQDEEKEDEEDEASGVYVDPINKFLTKANLVSDSSKNYEKYLNGLRLMLLHLLKWIHSIIKTHQKSSVCNFWQKLNLDKSFEEELEHKDRVSISSENIINTDERNEHGFDHVHPETLDHFKKECSKDICYLFDPSKRTEEKLDYLNAVKAKEVIARRGLCYELFKFVSDQIQRTKSEMENRKNRDVYTGILIKKKKYKIDNDVTSPRIGDRKRSTVKQAAPSKFKSKLTSNEKESMNKQRSSSRVSKYSKEPLKKEDTKILKPLQKNSSMKIVRSKLETTDAMITLKENSNSSSYVPSSDMNKEFNKNIKSIAKIKIENSGNKKDLVKEGKVVRKINSTTKKASSIVIKKNVKMASKE